MSNLYLGIRKSIDLIYKQASDRAAQRKAMNELLSEVKSLSALQKEQATVQKEEPAHPDQSSAALEKELARLNQKAEALMEALASFIPPDGENR